MATTNNCLLVRSPVMLTSACPLPPPKIFDRVSGRGSWDEKDLDDLRAAYSEHDHSPKAKVLTTQLEWWTRTAEFGDLLLSALSSYVGAFFAEEEKRIAPMLRRGLEQAQELADLKQLPRPILPLRHRAHPTN